MSEGSTNQAGRWAAGVGKDSHVVDDSSDKTPLLPKDSPDLDCTSKPAQGTETAKDSCSFESPASSKTVEETGLDSLLKGAKKAGSTPDPRSPPQGSSTAKTGDNTSDPQNPSKRQLTAKSGDNTSNPQSPSKRQLTAKTDNTSDPQSLPQGSSTAKTGDNTSDPQSPSKRQLTAKTGDNTSDPQSPSKRQLMGKTGDNTSDPQSPSKRQLTAKTGDNTSDPQSPSKRQLTGKTGDKAPDTHSPPKRSPAAGDASPDPDSPSPPSAAAKAAEDRSGSGVPATKAKTAGGKDSVTVTEAAKTGEDPHHSDSPAEQAKAASSDRDSPTEGATGRGGLEDSTTDDSELEVTLRPECKRVLMEYELLRLKQSEWILQAGPGRLDVLHDEHMASHPGKRLHQESETQRGVVSNLLRSGRWDLIISMKRELQPDAADMVARRAIDEYKIDVLMEIVPSANFREGTLSNILDKVCLRPELMPDAHKIIRLLPPTLLPQRVIHTYRALQYWHGGDLDFDKSLLFMKHDVLRELRRHFGIEEDSAGKPFKP